MQYKWTEETCREESKKYTTVIEFATNNNSAYKIAKKNGWIYSYTWLGDVKPKKKWNDEITIEESKKYTRRRDFMLNSPSGYDYAYRHGLLDKMTWLKYTPKKSWNIDTCYKEAQKYNSRNEFKLSNNHAYNVARKNGWLDSYTWFNTLKYFGEDAVKKDNVYAYEFIELNYVYVGRTINIKTRDYEHRNGIGYNHHKESAVYKFAKLHNINVPTVKILETNITILEGRKLEGIWLNRYIENGWNILNKAKCGENCGALGTLGRKWTKPKCEIESKKYNSRSEFRKNCLRGYTVARKNGWLDSYTWLNNKKIIITKQNHEKNKHVKKYNKRISKYTYDYCKELSIHCTSRSEFKAYNPSAYTVARKNGWLDSYTWLKPKKHTNYTYEECKEIACTCKSRGYLQYKNPSVYDKCRIKGWLDDFFPKI